MDDGGIIVRAFEIARSGSCQNVTEVRRQLTAEGYSLFGHFDGPSIKRQLLALTRAAKADLSLPAPKDEA
jgi:hypothetical protein